MEQVLLKNIEELKKKDLSVPAAVVISGGQLKYCELPSHGTVTFTTHDNKVNFVEYNEKQKF